MKLTTFMAAVAVVFVFSQSAQARGHHFRHEGHHHEAHYREGRHHEARYQEARYHEGRYHEARYREARHHEACDREARRHGFARHHFARADHWRSRSFAASAWQAEDGGSRRGGHGGLGPRPAAWCGWEMRRLVGRDPGPQFNLARNWARWGHAGPAGVGAVVVWPHHVGRIVGQQNGQWVIESGNDGHALRTRPRSIAGAIAIRWG